jgi:hypothetical protein
MRYYMDDDLESDPDHRRFDATTALVVRCFTRQGLRLDIDAVRRWSEEDEEAAKAWLDGEGAAPEPPVIAAARAEYIVARKCGRCGCTDYYRCDGGCVLDGAICSRCR